MAFDSIKAIHRLEAVGIQRAAAEEVVELISEAIRSEVATKSDLQNEAQTIRTEVKAEATALRGDVRELRAQLEHQITKGIMQVIGGVSAVVALFRLVENLLAR